MSPDFSMKGVVASYLASPRGMEMFHHYIISNEGHAAIREYLTTPRGRQTALDLLRLVLDAVDLPGDIKNSVRENHGKKNQHAGAVPDPRHV